MVEGSSPSAPTNFLGVNSRSTFSLNALSALVLNHLRTGRSQSASAVGLALRFTLKRSALRAPQDRQHQKGDISNEVRKGVNDAHFSASLNPVQLSAGHFARLGT